MRVLTLETSDHIFLSVSVFEPKLGNKKLVLINSATGVKQQIYFAISQYLADHGFTVITYDYRGIGESKPKVMTNFDANMRIWGAMDFKTITDYIQENYPHYNTYCVGHSVGALILGMNPDSVIFKKFVFVATQDAALSNLKLGVAATAVIAFGVALPLLTRFYGYFPAQRFGLGESLPKNVGYDWRTLILDRKSLTKLYEKLGEDYSKDLCQPVTVLFAEDDSWITMKGMQKLLKKTYSNLKASLQELKVVDSPKKNIGHINFFRSYNKNFWSIILDEFNADI